MATKCIVIGEGDEGVQLKPIQLGMVILHDKEPYFKTNSYKASDYKNIELLHRGCNGQLDLMLAYDVERKNGDRYLGHWNDGIV